jgi:K+-sensing histidine kinase KdpD
MVVCDRSPTGVSEHQRGNGFMIPAMDRRDLAASTTTLAGYAAAVAAPGALTLVLVGVSFDSPRDYAFLYLSIVAVLGVASGVGPALVAAALSTILVDYLFVPPKHTLSIGNTEDVVNLLVFFGAAGLVGTLGSLRRNAQLRSQALATELQRANLDLAGLNREQAEAAHVAARLAERDRQVQVLEETDRARHEFFANVSHELRTPLGGILTGATAVLRRVDLQPSLRAELDEVAAAARRLNRLVSDMLDMARIEGGAIDLRLDRVDLADAIDAAVRRLSHANPRRRIEVHVAPGTPEVMADWDRLGQVIDNLLANADHFAPDGTAVVISAVPADESGVVRVIDMGPGVPREQHERIFERFVRGSGGTGLGLPIVRGLVTAQGGRVWLEEPAAGEGGRFAFSMPRA